MSKKYICPICGFDGLVESPYDKNGEPSYEICPCCGFEFGVDEDDIDDKYKAFRLNWINNGAKWFVADKKPKDWDLERQFKNIQQI